MISRILYPKLKYIRNFPLYNCLQSKSNSKKSKRSTFPFSYSLFVIHLLLRVSTDESLNSFAKVTLFFDTTKQIVSFFFIFLIFSAF